MKDQDVRFAVHHKLLKESHLDPDCLVVDEFSISLGASRADIAVINGVIHGYELKSEYDSLNATIVGFLQYLTKPFDGACHYTSFICRK